MAVRVAVIGAGIVGASVAFRLSRSGAEVHVLDRGGAASGTTSVSFAWINANSKTPREYFELNRAGMEEHLKLADELPEVSPWLQRDGNLIWAEGSEFEELERRVERLRSWDYAAEWWTASRVREKLEPQVTFTNPESPIAFFREEAWVDAPRLTNLLLDRAVERGAVARPGVGVAGIGMDGGRVTGVELADGDNIRVDAVVNAAGTAADGIAAMVGRELPLVTRNGLIARVSAKAGILRRLLHTPNVNLRPDGPQRVILHHGSVDEKLTGGDEERLAEKLLDRAREILPALADAKLEEVRVGTRPVPGDGLSCVGGVAGLPGYYEAVTHSGVTLGPLIGRLLAREILIGEIDPLLAPFRPDRFAIGRR